MQFEELTSRYSLRSCFKPYYPEVHKNGVAAQDLNVHPFDVDRMQVHPVMNLYPVTEVCDPRVTHPVRV